MNSIKYVGISKRIVEFLAVQANVREENTLDFKKLKTSMWCDKHIYMYLETFQDINWRSGKEGGGRMIF